MFYTPLFFTIIFSPSMDELSALVWQGSESAEALNQKIFLTTLEIDSAKTEVERVKRQCMLNELHLNEKLQIAHKERDLAIMQLQLLLDSLAQPATTRLVEPGVTELYGNNVDSYFATAEQMENSNQYEEEYKYSQQRVEEHNSGSVITPVLFLGTGQPMVVGHASRVVENHVNGKMLPQRRRLLEAVMKAGPTLQDMMVAGPIPQWKNPPPIQQLNIPPALPNSGGIMMNNTGATTQIMPLPRFSNNIAQISPLMMSPSSFCGSVGMSGPAMADLSGGSPYPNPNPDAQLNIFSKKQLIVMGKRPRII